MVTARIPAALINLVMWPGIGHFLMRRYVRGSVWAALMLVSMLLAPVHVLVPTIGMVATRVLSAIDAGLVLPKVAIPRRWVWIGVVGGFGATLLLSLLIRIYYVEAFKIPSRGMSPTLVEGDHVYANKMAYRFETPRRDDLAVFVWPCDANMDFISRIVALAGDTVEVRCDVLYVNGVAAPAPGQDGAPSAASPTGQRLPGKYDFPGDGPPQCDRSGAQAAAQVAPGRIERTRTPEAEAQDPCRPLRHYVVPDGHVFTMGDNRDHSYDSRMWGPVPLDQVKGRLIGIWWSHTRGSGIRWDRFGNVP